jgi:hypothetical protein
MVKWLKYVNYKLESAEISIIICLIYVPIFRYNLEVKFVRNKLLCGQEHIMCTNNKYLQEGPVNGEETIDPTTLDVVPVQPDKDPVPILPSYTEAGKLNTKLL